MITLIKIVGLFALGYFVGDKYGDQIKSRMK